MNHKLSTAVAALVAALSVAVMIDSAPAKTSIGSKSPRGSDVTPWMVTHSGSGGTYRLAPQDLCWASASLANAPRASGFERFPRRPSG
jgi:hypothetical protein